MLGLFRRVECGIAVDTIKRLLPSFFDPLEDFTTPDYLELARGLLESYRCEKLLRLEKRKEESIDETIIVLRKLIELSANTVVAKYSSLNNREKLRESIKTMDEKEVKMLNKYLKLGLQLTGYNLTSLVPFLSDKLFVQYLGTVLKMVAIITVGVKKYWAMRTIRKFSVSIELLSREIIEKLNNYERNRGWNTIGVANDIIGEATSTHSLIEFTGALYKEQVYANTPEVVAFARELQELRKELLEAR